MKRRNILPKLVIVFLVGILLVNVYRYFEYREMRSMSKLEGTIFTRLLHSGAPLYGIALIDPNNVNNYVSLDIGGLMRVRQWNYIGTSIMNKNEIYVFGGNIETERYEVICLTPEKIIPLQSGLKIRKPAEGQLAIVENGIAFFCDDSIYYISEEHQLALWKSDCQITGRIYSSVGGIIYQEGGDVKSLQGGIEKVLFSIPENAEFRGWYEKGKA